MNLKLSSGQFYGNTLMSYETGEIRLTETIYPKYYNLQSHSHENSYFKLVLAGSYSESFDTKTRACEKSMLTFHPEGEVHAQHFNQTEVKLFRVELSQHWLSKYLDEFGSLKHEPAVFQGDVVCQLAGKLYNEFRRLDNISALVIEGLALEMIGEMIRSRTDACENCPPRWLKQAHELICEQSTGNLTLSLIAQAVGVHPVHLSREFHRYYHSTIGDYIRRLRIEFACRELIKPNSSLADIAVACGFHDQSHFTKTFKIVLNTTPSIYRDRFSAH